MNEWIKLVLRVVIHQRRTFCLHAFGSLLCTVAEMYTVSRFTAYCITTMCPLLWSMKNIVQRICLATYTAVLLYPELMPVVPLWLMCSKITKVQYDIIWTALYSPIYSFMQTQLFVSKKKLLCFMWNRLISAQEFLSQEKNRTCCAQSFPGVLQLSLA